MKAYKLSILSAATFLCSFSQKQSHPSCLKYPLYEDSFFVDFRGCLDSSLYVSIHLRWNQTWHIISSSVSLSMSAQKTSHWTNRKARKVVQLAEKDLQLAEMRMNSREREVCRMQSHMVSGINTIHFRYSSIQEQKKLLLKKKVDKLWSGNVLGTSSVEK